MSLVFFLHSLTGPTQQIERTGSFLVDFLSFLMCVCVSNRIMSDSIPLHLWLQKSTLRGLRKMTSHSFFDSTQQIERTGSWLIFLVDFLFCNVVRALKKYVILLLTSFCLLLCILEILSNFQAAYFRKSRLLRLLRHQHFDSPELPAFFTVLPPLPSLFELPSTLLSVVWPHF